MKWKRILLILNIIILIVGCSPQKRLNRLINKYPHLTVTDKDTIKVFDTIYLDSFDTLVRSEIIYSDSTIIINNDRVFAKYYYDTLRQEIIHEIKFCNSLNLFLVNLIVFMSFVFVCLIKYIKNIIKKETLLYFLSTLKY